MGSNLSALEAANNGDLVRLKRLVDNDPDCLKSQVDKHGRNVLHAACYHGYLDIVQYIVEQQDLNFVLSRHNTSNYGSIPLHFACCYGHLPVVKFLLEISNPVEQLTHKKKKNGHTPLHLAISEGQQDIVLYLMCYRYAGLNKDNYLPMDLNDALKVAQSNKQKTIAEFLQLLVEAQPKLETLMIQYPRRVNVDAEMELIQLLNQKQPTTTTEWLEWNKRKQKLDVLFLLCIFDGYQTISQLQQRINRIGIQMTKCKTEFVYPLLKEKERYEKQLLAEQQQLKKLQQSPHQYHYDLTPSTTLSTSETASLSVTPSTQSNNNGCECCASNNNNATSANHDDNNNNNVYNLPLPVTTPLPDLSSATPIPVPVASAPSSSNEKDDLPFASAVIL